MAKLLALRDITKLTGTLADLQLHQLQMWGRLAFEGVSSWKLSWDGEERRVEYRLDPPLNTGVRMLMNYFQAIDNSLKGILGMEWLLEVWEGDHLLFSGARRQPWKTQRGNLDQVPTRGEMAFDARGKT